jgi:hypothetical protein
LAERLQAYRKSQEQAIVDTQLPHLGNLEKGNDG